MQNPSDMTTIASGPRRTALHVRRYEGGSSPGVAVIDHRDGNQVVARLSYPGRPHGVDLAPGKEGDDDEEDDD
jgi:hypothetical protein